MKTFKKMFSVYFIMSDNRFEQEQGCYVVEQLLVTKISEAVIKG